MRPFNSKLTGIGGETTRAIRVVLKSSRSTQEKPTDERSSNPADVTSVSYFAPDQLLGITSPPSMTSTISSALRNQLSNQLAEASSIDELKQILATCSPSYQLTLKNVGHLFTRVRNVEATKEDALYFLQQTRPIILSALDITNRNGIHISPLTSIIYTFSFFKITDMEIMDKSRDYFIALSKYIQCRDARQIVSAYDTLNMLDSRFLLTMLNTFMHHGVSMNTFQCATLCLVAAQYGVHHRYLTWLARRFCVFAATADHGTTPRHCQIMLRAFYVAKYNDPELVGQLVEISTKVCESFEPSEMDVGTYAYLLFYSAQLGQCSTELAVQYTEAFMSRLDTSTPEECAFLTTAWSLAKYQPPQEQVKSIVQRMLDGEQVESTALSQTINCVVGLLDRTEGKQLMDRLFAKFFSQEEAPQAKHLIQFLQEAQPNGIVLSAEQLQLVLTWIGSIAKSNPRAGAILIQYLYEATGACNSVQAEEYIESISSVVAGFEKQYNSSLHVGKHAVGLLRTMAGLGLTSEVQIVERIVMLILGQPRLMQYIIYDTLVELSAMYDRFNPELLRKLSEDFRQKIKLSYPQQCSGIIVMLVQLGYEFESEELRRMVYPIMISKQDSQLVHATEVLLALSRGGGDAVQETRNVLETVVMQHIHQANQTACEQLVRSWWETRRPVHPQAARDVLARAEGLQCSQLGEWRQQLSLLTSDSSDAAGVEMASHNFTETSKEAKSAHCLSTLQQIKSLGLGELGQDDLKFALRKTLNNVDNLNMQECIDLIMELLPHVTQKSSLPAELMSALSNRIITMADPTQPESLNELQKGVCGLSRLQAAKRHKEAAEMALTKINAAMKLHQNTLNCHSVANFSLSLNRLYRVRESAPLVTWLHDRMGQCAKEGAATPGAISLHLVNAAIARVHPTSQEVTDTIIESLKQNMDDVAPADAVYLLKALSQLQWQRDDAFLYQLKSRALQEISNVSCSLMPSCFNLDLNMTTSELHDIVSKMRVSQIPPKQAAVCMHALAMYGWQGPNHVLQELSKKIMQKIDRLEAKHLSMLATSWIVLPIHVSKQQHDQLFEKLEQQGQRGQATAAGIQLLQAISRDKKPAEWRIRELLDTFLKQVRAADPFTVVQVVCAFELAEIKLQQADIDILVGMAVSDSGTGMGLLRRLKLALEGMGYEYETLQYS